MLKRCTDIILAAVLIALLSVPLWIIALVVKISSKGAVLYWSERIGIHNKRFKMPKFRTMKTDTPAVATHFLENSDLYVTPVGRFLRKTSLDELPQLYSVLRGDMSFVGPRPALFNQYGLIGMRTERKVDSIIPGITGWAQIMGRDEISIPQKVAYDTYYYRHRSFAFDLKILVITFAKVLTREGVRH